MKKRNILERIAFGTSIFIALAGCSGIKPNIERADLACRHRAIACALAVKEKYPNADIRIAYGPAKFGDSYHAQAKVRFSDKEEWQYISGMSNFCSIEAKPEAFYDKADMDIWKYIHSRLLPEKIDNSGL